MTKYCFSCVNAQKCEAIGNVSDALLLFEDEKSELKELKKGLSAEAQAEIDGMIEETRHEYEKVKESTRKQAEMRGCPYAERIK